ncbi:hypothetical protein RND71_036462 [Anisodus tanguticus]|uniref:Uncharacterized protein n=1 Tax=Anisodus tanguticus TaxID=243964 RepID=A0AAE1R1V3_9SOLA|nr:hypothetical protein RND71_036462 [Anisodus tanguticus]
MSQEKAQPNSSISLSDKDVKAPNVFERVKEEIEAMLHSERQSHHHHKETHGMRKDIDENTPISDVKAPNVFERAKEEIEALFEALHLKKEDHSHASPLDVDKRLSFGFNLNAYITTAKAELSYAPWVTGGNGKENKAKVPDHNERSEEEIGAHPPREKYPHPPSDDIDANTPISEVKGPNIFERAKEEIEALLIDPKN